MLSDLITRPCTLNRATGTKTKDRYGNKRAASETVETVCELQQRRRTEDPEQGELSDTVWDLFLPAGTELTTADSVTVDGVTYQLVGDPWPVRNPATQQDSHVEATVRRAQ
jgi:hypothetical protein